MKKLITALMVASVVATPALADGHGHGHGGYQRTGAEWVAPMIGGMILGGVLSDMNRPRYVVPPPVVVAPPPVYANPNPYGVPPNPYIYRNCYWQEVYSQYGQYLGQHQVCN